MLLKNALRGIGALALATLIAIPSAVSAGPINVTNVTITGPRTEGGRADQTPWSGSWFAFSQLELGTGFDSSNPLFIYDTATSAWIMNPAVTRTTDVTDPNFNTQHNSTFVLYDALVKELTGTNPGAALMECKGDDAHDFSHSIYGAKKEEYDRDGVSYSWWGHCNGWCAAALMEKEPLSSVTVKGIRFEVADIKGLLAETYWGVESDFTGRRYNKPRDLYTDNLQEGKDLLAALDANSPNPVAEYITWYETVYDTTMTASAKANAKAEDFRDELDGLIDWYKDRYVDAFEDLAPHKLQELLATLIKDQNIAFVMDVTANEEVWNHPAYAYNTEYTHSRDFTENGKNLKEWNVTTEVFYATDGVSHSIVGIKAFSKTYTSKMVTDETDKVIRSEWTGNSVDNHPDFAWLPTHNAETSDDGENPNVFYRHVKEILPKVHEPDEAPALVINVDGAPTSVSNDKTTSWTTPKSGSGQVALTVDVASGQTITKVKYFEQQIERYSGYTIAKQEPLLVLAESSTGPNYPVSVSFNRSQKKAVLAYGYNGDRLVFIAETAIDYSVSGGSTGGTAADDNYEPNNSRTAAATLIAGSYPNMVCNDSDWFKVRVPANSELTFKIDFSHSQGDIDMKSYNSSDSVLETSDSANNDEEIAFTTTSTAKTVYFRVYGYSGAVNNYGVDVTITTSSTGGNTGGNTGGTQGIDNEPNNSRSAASAVTAGHYPNNNCADDDWFKFTVAEDSEITVSIAFSHSAGDLDLFLYNAAGTKIGSSESTADQESKTLTVTAGTYYAKVFGYNGATGAYDLTYAVTATGSTGGNTGGSNGDDSFEENDTESAAAALSVGTHNIIVKDDDFFAITVPAGATVKVEASFQHSSGDIDMKHIGGATSETTGNVETVVLTASGKIRVYGYNGAQNTVVLTVTVQ
jgi:hypothetical protein